MANNYQQFSALLAVSDPEERRWWEQILASRDDPDGPLLKIVAADGTGAAGFDAELVDDGVWFFAEECGDVEQVAVVVQEFFRQHRRGGVWGFEWADWCSKLRIGEFGGGAVVVTAGDIRWMPTSQWLADRIRELTVDGDSDA